MHSPEPANEPGAAHAGAPDRVALLEQLSDRLLAVFPLPVWRRAFLSRAYEQITFERCALTFLCTHAGPDWSEHELGVLASRHGGRLDAHGTPTVLAFPGADDALKVALLLQRTSGRRLRIALSSAACWVACVEVDAAARRIAVGPEVDQAAANLELSSPGTIHLCAATFRALEPTIEQHTHQAVLSTEVRDGRVMAAEITLPPARQADLSTFAGLGLT